MSPRTAGDPPPLPDDVPQIPVPIVESASDDVAPGATVTLPGEHRGGFQRALTEPVPVTEPVHTEVRWAPPPPPPLPRSGPWALTFAIMALIVSLLVGWGFPIGLVGAVLAVVALRRPWESRSLAVWALCLSLLSLLYSAGWLWWAWSQGDLFA
jgi:hypothetical protein